jgi:hypothetical protein
MVWTTWRRENSWPYRELNSGPLDRQAHIQSQYRLRYYYFFHIYVFNDAVSLELGVTSRTKVQWSEASEKEMGSPRSAGRFMEQLWYRRRKIWTQVFGIVPTCSAAVVTQRAVCWHWEHCWYRGRPRNLQVIDCFGGTSPSRYNKQSPSPVATNTDCTSRWSGKPVLTRVRASILISARTQFSLFMFLVICVTSQR